MKADACVAALLAELKQALELIEHLESHLHDPELCRALVPRLMSSIQNSILIASDDRPPRSSHFQGPRSEAETPKRRKTLLHSWTRKVRLSSVAGGVEGAGHDDGFTWRKYGQKEILGAKYPRAYFRCAHSASHGCPAKKQVQRSDDDLLVFDVTYHGHHTCLQQPREQGSDSHAMCERQEQSMAARLEAEEFVAQTVPSLGSSMDEFASFGPLYDYCFSPSPCQMPDWELSWSGEKFAHGGA
ncbi:transcription factor WRKY19-like [Curcuma longa]|uniref:transcription factor WRKY19-like n=1 Tax=Curcuma longa TaxID=136217 RepID=UPI003D9E5577